MRRSDIVVDALGHRFWDLCLWRTWEIFWRELQFVKIESIPESKHKKNIKFYRTEIDIFLRVESLENIIENVCVVPRVRSTA